MNLSIIKGKTLEGILFDGTFEHAVEIGKFLTAGFTIERIQAATIITLKEVKDTVLASGDFLVLNGEPMRVIPSYDIKALWDEVKVSRFERVLIHARRLLK